MIVSRMSSLEKVLTDLQKLIKTLTFYPTPYIKRIKLQLKYC